MQCTLFTNDLTLRRITRKSVNRVARHNVNLVSLCPQVRIFALFLGKKENVMLRSILLVILFAFSATVYADGFNYNSVTATYGQIDFDDLSGVDTDLFGIEGSFAVSESFHVFAGYSVGEIEDSVSSVDMDQWNVGLGYNTSLSDRVDLVVGLSYEYIELSAANQISIDDNGIGLSVGLRMAATEKLEVDAGISYVDFSDGGDNTAFGGGVLYNFTESFALGASISFDDDATGYNVGGRFYFGN